MTVTYKRWSGDRPHLVDRQEGVYLYEQDVIDSHGNIWQAGACWVEGEGVNNRRKGSKGRPFIGETAWADGRRLFNDTVWANRRRG